MKNVTLFLSTAVLAACGQSNPTTTETVESLVANPERLDELRQQCKLDRAILGDALCNRVAEANRRQYFGDYKTPYTPSKEPMKF